MEVEEIQTQAPSSKFPRLIGNGGRSDSVKIAQDYPDAEEDGNKLNRLRGWHNHSRIIRVSRASGGKDRHSKVLTSKGLRDRRVRLSVSTAIQFYDIQDRLGYDQPSKAVEWLIKAASEAIAELPSLKNSFPDTPKQLSDEKRASDGTEHGFDSADVHELDDHDPNDPSYQHQHSQQQHMSMSKSACSSTSETSKGSGLSLSRSEIRVNRVKKSRERARERTAKEKEKETTTTAATSTQQQPHQQPSLTPISQSSFTELLTGPGPQNSGARSHWMAASTPMDYFSAGQLLSRSHQQAGFLGQIQLPSQVMSLPPFTISGENSNSNNNHNHHHHQELQHFSFVPDHINLIPVTSHLPASEYNLNFTISPSSSSSSGLAGFNRGTLQSNSNTPSLLPQLQRFSSSSSSAVDGSNNMPFFIAPVDNHHNHHQQQLHIGQFSSGLQLCYGDGTRHNSDHKGKSKN